jgi:hypothetical protein
VNEVAYEKKEWGAAVVFDGRWQGHKQVAKRRRRSRNVVSLKHMSEEEHCQPLDTGRETMH